MKKLLLKFWYFLMKMIRKLDKTVEKLIPIVSNGVEALKVVIENGKIDEWATILKSLIPGIKDDLIIDTVVALSKKYIPEISLQLKIITSITNIDNPEQQLIEIFGKLQNASDTQRQMFFSQLAQQIVVDMAQTDDTPNKITWGESGVYLELYYQTVIKK